MIDKTMVLCKLRHKHPLVDPLEAIFPTEIDPFDYYAMHKMIDAKLKDAKSLNLYVTGLSPALVAVLNYCTLYSITCVLWHFNKLTGLYVKQRTMTTISRGVTRRYTI